MSLGTPIAEGTFAKTPCAHVLLYIRERHMTGTLFVNVEEGKFLFAFEEGKLAQAKVPPSDLSGGAMPDRLGEVLVSLGFLNKLDIEACANGDGLFGERLVNNGSCDARAIEIGLREQLRRRGLQLFLTEGDEHYAFYPSDLLADFGGPRFPIDVLPVVWAGIRRAGSSSAMEAILQRFAGHFLKLKNSFDPRSLGLDTETTKLVELLRTPHNIETFYRRCGELDLGRRLAYLLLVAKCVDAQNAGNAVANRLSRTESEAPRESSPPAHKAPSHAPPAPSVPPPRTPTIPPAPKPADPPVPVRSEPIAVSAPPVPEPALAEDFPLPSMDELPLPSLEFSPEPPAPPAPEPVVHAAPVVSPPPAVAAPVRAPVVAPRGKPEPPKIAAALEQIFRHARVLEASDLHVVPDRPALYRVAGELRPEGSANSAANVEQWCFGIVPARLRGELEVQGSCDFALEAPQLGRYRANVSRQRTGYKASFRLISQRFPTIATLGLPDAIEKATHQHQGLIVMTGPTGHGKTSTLTAALDLINQHTTHHVITVEDPVEYIHPRAKAMFSQREVGTHTKTFAAALKGSLREDPDVIAIGEMRDVETVRMALSASETGHLVLATMNTPSAARTIDRLIDMFPPADQAQVRSTLAGALRLIVSQRLVPRADRKGMAAAVEVLPGSMALWSLIRDNKTYQIPSLQQRGKALGIVRLDDSLSALVKSGAVTMEDARGFAEQPEEFEALVTGKKNLQPPPEPTPAPKEGGLLSRAGSFLGKKGG